MRGADPWLTATMLLLFVVGTTSPHHQCDATLNCGDYNAAHCHGIGTPARRSQNRCPDVTPGSYCEARCDDGWYMLNPWEGTMKSAQGSSIALENPYTCQCTGKNCGWAPVGSQSGEDAWCEPVTCPSAHVAPNAAMCPGDGLLKKCIPDCDPGYVPYGQEHEYTCRANGQWQGGTLHCYPQDFCPDPRSGLANRTLVSKPCGRTMGSVCEFACPHGYERVGGDATYRCDVDSAHTNGGGQPNSGAWVPVIKDDELRCERRCQIPAGGAGPVNYSRFVGGCDRKSGAQCTVRCDEGYENDSGNTGTYVCSGSSYTWEPAGGEGTALHCKLTGCPDTWPLGESNGTTCKSGPFGATCTPQCNSGFGGSTDAVYTCQQDHTWHAAGDAGHCSPKDNYCPTHEMHIEVVGACRGQVGERCNRSCTQGSARVEGPELGHGLFWCRPDGSWEADYKGNALACELTCDGVEPTAEHVHVPGAPDSNCKRLPREQCDAACDEHYKRAPDPDHKGEHLGSDDYKCVQSPDGSRAMWQPVGLNGAMQCIPDCHPGQEPINMTKTGSTEPCVKCVGATFSSDGNKCQPCLDYNHDRSLCYKCQAGHAPNRETKEWPAHTRCETCEELQMLVLHGECVEKDLQGLAYDHWEHEPPTRKVLTVFGCVAGLVFCGFVCKKLSSKEPLHERDSAVLSASFLGGSEKLPVAKLTELDVAARWVQAEQMHQDWASEADSLPDSPAPGAMAHSTVSGKSSATRRRRKGAANQLPVMFSNEHVRELQPSNWQTHPLGQGSFGVVYKATWRGQEVAVKVLKLPDLPWNSTAAANAALRKQVESITTDFVTEVEVCCDLNHPNLVRLLGYADRPQLMIMQELLRGNSMDKLLYVERWEPTHGQVLKAAHDVARGMEYLHTMFESGDNSHSQPIIHRDLKSPNLLLATRPMDGEGVLVKVTDFGLSRDKALSAVNTNHAATEMMTGCGSVLWMAPEIMTGDTYNEQVDIYSYAMCLIELVDRKLPWSRDGTLLAGPAEIPMKVTKGERPHKQLAGSAVDPRMASLIRDCWHQEPQQRPAFTTIVMRLEEMMGIVSTRALGYGAGGGSAASAGSGAGAAKVARGTLEPLLETSAEVGFGVTRPGSPDPES